MAGKGERFLYTQTPVDSFSLLDSMPWRQRLLQWDTVFSRIRDVWPPPPRASPRDIKENAKTPCENAADKKM
ncbi:MAG: hypothetical protein CBE20_03820 [Gammaproteobacteria bacterium TMED260]|nr:hypothetical protein [Gammaproteobacteria bacterium]OUX33865.1 MAG: hypothetical protein CBE20_03820 [Gammaproteobacteria bacterium TMED260]